MNHRICLLALATFLSSACAHASRSAPDQHVDSALPPSAREGLTNEVLATIALPEKFDMATGRTLRMRELRVAPRGSLPMHSHADRPAVAYVVRGEITVYPEDGSTPQVMRVGQAYTAFQQGHAFRNTSAEGAIVIEVDLIAGEQ